MDIKIEISEVDGFLFFVRRPEFDFVSIDGKEIPSQKFGLSRVVPVEEGQSLYIVQGEQKKTIVIDKNLAYQKVID